MLKKLLLAALWLPLMALAQTYPSPTYQNLTVLGTFTSTGNIGLPSLASQAANTVLANATASSASPTAFAMPSCSSATNALTWTSGAGFTCNSSINAATLGGATFASPGSIGSTTASTGAFTTLSASSTVSGAGFTNLLSPYAPLASAALTGTPTAPTAAAGTSTTQLATTAFVTTNSLPTGWTTYTPSISAQSGSYTTASATGTYTKIGKMVCMEAVATITTVGTGTGTILGLPVTANSGGNVQIIPGRENGVSGKMLQGVISPSGTTLAIWDYSNASAAASGAAEVVSGCYLGA